MKDTGTDGICLHRTLPTVPGKVFGKDVMVLRDTGCSTVIVNEDLVKEDAYIGGHGTAVFLDGGRRDLPRVRIDIVTPFLSGKVKAFAMKNCLYELVIGNVEGVQHIETCDATTRAQSVAARNRPSPSNIKEFPQGEVDRDECLKLQKNDPSSEKAWKKVSKGETEGKDGMEIKKDLLYRTYLDDRGQIKRQLVVPEKLRRRVLEQAHCAITGGHLGTGKTANKILTTFYWPGVHDDVARFCQSCDICRKTVRNSQERYKNYYDRKARRRELNVGDQVLVLLPTDHNKLLMHWKGPFLVEEKIARNDYAVRVKGKREIYHVNLLKKYYKDVPNQGQEDVLKCALSAVVEEDEGDGDDNNLLEIGAYRQKESWRDVRYGGALGDARDVMEGLVSEYQDMFTDKPGQTVISVSKSDTSWFRKE